MLPLNKYVLVFLINQNLNYKFMMIYISQKLKENEIHWNKNSASSRKNILATNQKI